MYSISRRPVNLELFIFLDALFLDIVDVYSIPRRLVNLDLFMFLNRLFLDISRRVFNPKTSSQFGIIYVSRYNVFGHK